jgi:hypothetical protein
MTWRVLYALRLSQAVDSTPSGGAVRRDLILTCLVAAPILGLLASSLAENPPGSGPGALQVVLAVGVAVGLSFVAARRVGLPWSRAFGWAVASAAVLPVLLLLVILLTVALTPL